MTDDPKKPFGVPPTSPIQPEQNPQGGFGQPQPPQSPQQGGYGQPPEQGGYGPPAQQPPAQQPSAQQPPHQGGFGGPPPGHQQPGFGQPQQPGGFGLPQGQSPQGGFGMPQGQPPGGAYIAPGHHGGAPELPTGLKTTAFVLLIVAPILTVVGLVPCLGILNWIAVPLNLSMTIIGILGLAIGPKLGDGKPANMNMHIAAIVVGVICAAVAFFRCLAGGGIA